MFLRFLLGFFGSPCLATGGASMGDMVGALVLPLWPSAANSAIVFIPIPPVFVRFVGFYRFCSSSTWSLIIRVLCTC